MLQQVRDPINSRGSWIEAERTQAPMQPTALPHLLREYGQSIRQDGPLNAALGGVQVADVGVTRGNGLHDRHGDVAAGRRSPSSLPSPLPSAPEAAGASAPPSGLGSSAFIERRRRPRSSRSMSFTRPAPPSSPHPRASPHACGASSETWRRASVPGMISMKAPNAVTDFHRARVGLAHHRLGGDRLHHLARALHRLAPTAAIVTSPNRRR